MNPETIEKIKEVLAPVALKIGEGAEFGWGVILKQQYVNAVSGFFWGIVGSVGFVLFLGWFIKKDKSYWEMAWFGSSLVLVGLFLMGMCGFQVAITHLINPEYYALRFFIDLVH